ncbi:MAG: hypothetical protein EA361_12595 [Bacteroidetes bacterium]|nr:MAG: hypothetical protein EA361_12595 [Bacteroidota bacterium]
MATVVQFIRSAQGDRRPEKNKEKRKGGCAALSFFSPTQHGPVILSAAKDPAKIAQSPFSPKANPRGKRQQVLH